MEYLRYVDVNFSISVDLAKREYQRKLSIYKVMSVIKLRIKLMNIKGKGNEIVPIITNFALTNSISNKLIENKSNNIIMIIMNRVKYIQTLKVCIKLFFSVIVKMIKRQANRFLIRHCARIQVLETYFLNYMVEYKKLLKKYKAQPFYPKMEESYKKLELISKNCRKKEYQKYLKEFYRRAKDKKKNTNNVLFYGKIKLEVESLGNVLYQAFTVGKKPKIDKDDTLLVPTLSEFDSNMRRIAYNN